MYYFLKANPALEEAVDTTDLGHLSTLLNRVNDKDQDVARATTMLTPYLTAMADKNIPAKDILRTATSFLLNYVRTLPEHPWGWNELRRRHEFFNSIWILILLPTVIAGIVAAADVAFSGTWIDTSGFVALGFLLLVGWWHIGAYIKSLDGYDMEYKKEGSEKIVYGSYAVYLVILAMAVFKATTVGVIWYYAVPAGLAAALITYLWRIRRTWKKQDWFVRGFYTQRSSVMLKVLKLTHEAVGMLVTDWNKSRMLQEALLKYTMDSRDAHIPHDDIRAAFPAVFPPSTN